MWKQQKKRVKKKSLRACFWTSNVRRRRAAEMRGGSGGQRANVWCKRASKQAMHLFTAHTHFLSERARAGTSASVHCTPLRALACLPFCFAQFARWSSRLKASTPACFWSPRLQRRRRQRKSAVCKAPPLMLAETRAAACERFLIYAAKFM